MPLHPSSVTRAALRVALALVATAACGRTEPASPSEDAAADGGATATTGTDAAGGATAGTTATGGATATAGTTGTGGVTASGGEAGTPTDSDCTLHVLPYTGDDTKDGASWDGAVRSLTRALALAHAGCEVWLASGTYTPTNDSNRDATFTVPDGVTLRGGFVGTERSPADRSFAELLPLLSGDIGIQDDSDDDAYHVVTTLGTATLDHLYLTHGHADSSFGGGAVVAAGALTIDTCNVYESLSDNEAGGVLAHAALTIRNSTFSSNGATERGGAIVADGPGPLVVESSLFEDNSAIEGGAISVHPTSGGASLGVTGSTFRNNVATSPDLRVAEGGAIDFEGTLLDVDTSVFEQNQATQAGGAINAQGGGALEIVDSLLVQNGALDGGAIFDAEADAIELTNDTISDNSSSYGAVGLRDGSSLVIANSILWHDGQEEIDLYRVNLGDPETLVSLYSNNLSGTYPNFTSFDPLFVDPAKSNYHLSDGSPCIDHGDDTRAPATDLDGNARVSEHGPSPSPSSIGISDMGAYEYGY